MESPPKGPPKGIAEQAAPERLGKYPLLSVIGKGSMGILYKSVDPHIKRPVALKTIRRGLRIRRRERLRLYRDGVRGGEEPARVLRAEGRLQRDAGGRHPVAAAR